MLLDWSLIEAYYIRQDNIKLFNMLTSKWSHMEFGTITVTSTLCSKKDTDYLGQVPSVLTTCICPLYTTRQSGTSTSESAGRDDCQGSYLEQHVQSMLDSTVSSVQFHTRCILPNHNAEKSTKNQWRGQETQVALMSEKGPTRVTPNKTRETKNEQRCETDTRYPTCNNSYGRPDRYQIHTNMWIVNVAENKVT